MKQHQITKPALIALLLTVSLVLTVPAVSAKLESSDIDASPSIMIYKIDGNYPMNHYVNPDWDFPIINTDDGNASIRVSVGISGTVYYPAGLGTLMNAGGYLTRVSYTASWLGDREVVVYRGDETTHQGGYQFNLTGIPYGNQTVSVSASCNVLLFGDSFASTYPVAQNGGQSVTFRVAHTYEENQNQNGGESEPLVAGVPPVQTEYAYIAATVGLFGSAAAIAAVGKKGKQTQN